MPRLWIYALLACIGAFGALPDGHGGEKMRIAVVPAPLSPPPRLPQFPAPDADSPGETATAEAPAAEAPTQLTVSRLALTPDEPIAATVTTVTLGPPQTAAQAPVAPVPAQIQVMPAEPQPAQPVPPDPVDQAVRRIEEQLLNSGFFDVVDRSEASIAAALEEIQFANDFSFQTDRAEFGKIAGIRYLVFVTLEESQSRESRPRARPRAIQVPDQGTTSTFGLRIMDVESMRIIHAQTREYRNRGKDPMAALARDAAARVVDSLYPFQIIARMGDRLYFNRGAETNVNIGDRLELFQAASVPDSATGNILTVEMPIAKVVVDRVQAWVCEAALTDPALMAKVSETTRAKVLPPPAAPPDVPEPEAPTLDW